jgi:hypothetical protein
MTHQHQKAVNPIPAVLPPLILKKRTKLTYFHKAEAFDGHGIFLGKPDFMYQRNR